MRSGRPETLVCVHHAEPFPGVSIAGIDDHVTDRPVSGRIVQRLVIARRFRCDAALCGRQIFTERFAEGVLAPSARRTARLDSIVHHLGLALADDRRQTLQND